jgi:predicted nucleotidyltransferase
MRLKHYSERKLKSEIREIIGRHLELRRYHIFFFGSRVRGSNFDRSDIDIGIEGPEELPGEILENIEEELDNLPTLYSFDFVDFKNASHRFKKEALKYVEKIN